jgi:hypothetical protein
MRFFLPIAIALALCGLGCSLNANIYDLNSGEVVHATFTYYGTGHGEIETRFPGGEICRGEYSTVAQGSIGWGSIFGAVYGPGGSASATGTGFSTSMNSMQHGRAIATSRQGRVIECEYVTSIDSHGWGGCRDNRGETYRLMF